MGMTDDLWQQFEDRGCSGLERLRENTSGTLCELTPLGPTEDFVSSGCVVHMGTGVLFDAQMSAVRLLRRPFHVARSGMDHYQVRFHFDGGYCAEQQGRRIVVKAGDIGVNDMTEPEDYQLCTPGAGEPARFLALFVPRSLLAPMLSDPDAVGTTVISGDSPYGWLLAQHLVATSRRARELSLTEKEAVIRGTATLLAGGLGCSAAGAGTVEQGRREALQAAIKRYVKANLGSARLGVAALTAHFRLSRATLFRLFEEEGGIVHYIQRCQLEKAFAGLISNVHRRKSILELSLECGFESESGFIRAFRRRFGVTPGELRRIADARPTPLDLAPALATEGAVKSLRWLGHLSAWD